ncbi:helix-turn-helix domain-containing protein [Kitasatospora sp. GAS1066B]|uniref:helix-turn-helix domain-containing protein n=1 Tax=Kitasatospora sp. GAS1066B TaxID=3156271 RepID=UPI00351195CE
MVVGLYRDGQSIKAIAALMGVSTATISRRLADWGENKRDVRAVGRLNAAPSYGRGQAVGRRPWAAAFAASGGRGHCPDCRELTAERQRARARGESEAVASGAGLTGFVRPGSSSSGEPGRTVSNHRL